MTHDEMIAVIQAHKDGKTIENRLHERSFPWLSAGDPSFNFRDYDYRVKPEPREFWCYGCQEDSLICSSTKPVGYHDIAIKVREVIE